ncbi:MAG: saccharopine dehydrogenase C-terminal domain-containing protein, partial [Desulfurococcaceae archaeon]
CLPGSVGYRFMAACAELGVKLVDVSFTREDPLTLNPKASETGSLIVPDCGVAPGLSNIVVGLSAKNMDVVEKAEIRVGGIPLHPDPPFYHSSSWSTEDLIEEYARPARYVEGGAVKSCSPLDLVVP